MLEKLEWPLRRGRRGRRSSDTSISRSSGQWRWSGVPVLLLHLLFAATVTAKGQLRYC